MSESQTSRLLDVQYYLDVAQTHGEDSEPDHEVGDLQDFLRAVWEHLTAEQRDAIARDERVHTVLEGAGADYEKELEKLAD